MADALALADVSVRRLGADLAIEGRPQLAASTGRPVARSMRSAQVALANFSAEISLPVSRSST